MKNVIAIAKKLQKIWKKTYIVGSFNVHKILHKNFWSDYDLTTPATPDEIRSVLHVVWEIWSKYWTLIVKEWWQKFEITTFRKDIWSVNKRKPLEVIFTSSLEEDCIRRDFTFNAIYYDILDWKYIDPTWGIEDIKNWIIRFVWNVNERLDEDILRILRYVRLKNKYNFTSIDNNYDEIISSRISELQSLPSERIKQEFDKMLLDKTNIESLKDLKKFGFFREFLPQIDNLSRSPGGKIIHIEWDNWIHTLLSIKELNRLKCNDIDILWATLLHDIWKYTTYEYNPEWNIHYYRHEEESVKMFKDYMIKVLPFSKKSIWKISWLIKNHIRIWTIEEMKKLKKYHFMLNPYFKDLITLYIADNLWKKPPDKKCWPRLQDLYSEFIEKFEKTHFFNWNDIMKMYPNLKWRGIWLKLKEENDKILSDL
ncbi:MAG: metal dependent phosphohydrolase [uncultured bacterium (gcode 4)]|uniref:Metal dependent phosphohydrolase n=1 Tax=uncultured bacterium (gcode 4) TaxID=1234023 RepID=K2FW40_9BACT|nr:MAG: metal dependent phosphohydrolase [uncultured bacterium (gcode 4)]